MNLSTKMYSPSTVLTARIEVQGKDYDRNVFLGEYSYDDREEWIESCTNIIRGENPEATIVVYRSSYMT